MSELPANWAPAPPTPPRPGAKSAWKPLLLILLSSLGLAVITCGGGFALGKDGGGPFFLYAGLVFMGIFVMTLAAIVVYFFIWMAQKSGSHE